MRYSLEHKQATRKRIMAAASQSFRVSGYSGVGVDGLVQEAAVTSGAFYRHFRSKTDAFRAVVAVALERLRDGIVRVQKQNPDAWIEALAEHYFSAAHRKDVAGGCGLPSLSGDVSRADPETKAAFEAILLQVHNLIASNEGLPSRGNEQERAWVILALLAGGVTLSRAVKNPSTAHKIAHAVRNEITNTNGSTSK